MLSITNKQTIYSAVKTAYTVDTKSFTASVIYANQTISGYPTITLNYPEEDILDQPSPGGEYLGASGIGQRSLAWLSMNVYAQPAQTKNAFTIGHDIALQLRKDIRQNWKSLTGGLKFNKMSQARDLSMLETGAGIQLARIQFDVYLKYESLF